jgi:hypothetical protein
MIGQRPKLSAAGARKMVGDLATRQTIMWVGVALVIHVVLIAATSTGYIRDHWIDPKGAQVRREAALREEEERKAAATAPRTPATSQPVSAAPAKPAASGEGAAEKRMLEERKDSKVVRDITEPAKPNEIPKEPTRNGFELDEQLN